MVDTQVVEEVTTDTTVKVEYDGKSYTFDSGNLSDLDFMEPWEDGQYVSATRALLGAESWTLYRAEKHDYTHLLGLFSACLKAANKPDED